MGGGGELDTEPWEQGETEHQKEGELSGVWKGSSSEGWGSPLPGLSNEHVSLVKRRPAAFTKGGDTTSSIIRNSRNLGPSVRQSDAGPAHKTPTLLAPRVTHTHTHTRVHMRARRACSLPGHPLPW